MSLHKNTLLSCILVGLPLFLAAQQMYPGDANNNGIVNAVDVLYIGLANGADGPEREGATTVFTAQDFELWPQSFPDGINYGHADSDGDGEIEDDDVESGVAFNFGLSTGAPQIPDPYANAAPGSNAPAVHLVPSSTLVQEGAVVDISLQLGDDNLPIQNFYGVAFKFSYDQELLQDLQYDDLDETWINADMAETEDLFVNDLASGASQLAVTRLNQTTIGGSGEIAEFSIFIEDIIVGLTVDTFRFRLDSVLLIDETLKTTPLIPDTATILIARDTNLVSTKRVPQQLPARVYPNPAREYTLLYSPAPLEQLQLLDAYGRQHWSARNTPGGSQLRIPLRGLLPGLYELRGWNEQGYFVRKLLIQ